MAERHFEFISDEIYHVYNRGADKRETFMSEEDYLRFVQCLYVFNDADMRPAGKYLPTQQVQPVQQNKNKKYPERKRLVDIICWCAMPNHFHLMLRQIMDGGVTSFMRKFATAYTSSFNKKYERSGVLFQGRFKAEHVGKEAYLLHLPFYIHSNPIDLVEYEWKEKNIRNFDAVTQFLENYRWSSLQDYMGKKNFPSLINGSEFVLQKMRPDEYKREFYDSLAGDDARTHSSLNRFNL